MTRRATPPRDISVKSDLTPSKQETNDDLRALTDPKLLASASLIVVPVAERLLSVVEHADFLMSINDKKFESAYNFFQNGGWVVVVIIGLIWGVSTWRNRSLSSREVTWGVVAAFAVVSFIVGAFLSVTVGGGVPRVIVSYGGYPQCTAQMDTSKLQSFRDQYKIAMVCFANDPSDDIMSDKNIIVSNLFTIPLDGLTIVSPFDSFSRFIQNVPAPTPGPEMTKTPTSTTPQMTQRYVGPSSQLGVGYIAVLIPNDVGKDKITTLSDVVRLGGKILDPRYYR